MSRTVTFKRLKKTLTAFGFEPEEHGGHIFFRHAKAGVVLTVPSTERTVRPVYVSNAGRQIANSGIATTSTFESRLEKAANEAA